MIIVLAALLACPLLSQGVRPNSVSAYTDGARSVDFVIYVYNPSPFNFDTSRIDVWVPDASRSRTAHAVPEDVRRTTIPAQTSSAKAIEIHFQDAAMDLDQAVGSSAECDD